MQLRLTFFIGMLCIAACARQPDADAIRQMIAAMGTATEAHRSADVLSHVSDDFIGNAGEIDRLQLANLLRMQLLANRHVGVRLGAIEVSVDADRATARFDATLSDASGRWLEDRSETLHLETGWRRESGVWRCYNARWKRVR